MYEDDLYPPLSALYDDYTHIEVVGAGKFGQVFRVTSNKTGMSLKLNFSHLCNFFIKYIFLTCLEWKCLNSILKNYDVKFSLNRSTIKNQGGHSPLSFQLSRQNVSAKAQSLKNSTIS